MKRRWFLQLLGIGAPVAAAVAVLPKAEPKMEIRGTFDIPPEKGLKVDTIDFHEDPWPSNTQVVTQSDLDVVEYESSASWYYDAELGAAVKMEDDFYPPIIENRRDEYRSIFVEALRRWKRNMT